MGRVETVPVLALTAVVAAVVPCPVGVGPSNSRRDPSANCLTMNAIRRAWTRAARSGSEVALREARARKAGIRAGMGLVKLAGGGEEQKRGDW